MKQTCSSTAVLVCYQRGGLSKKFEKQLSMVSLMCLFGGNVLKRPLDYINEALLLYHWRINFHG